MYQLGTQYFVPTTLSFERAVIELTSGRVRAFEDHQGWSFFDYDAQDHPTPTWYRNVYGKIKKEELFVRSMALRALIEVENRQRYASN